MDILIEIMRKVLADAYAFQLKANNYHWNVEGPNFPQYHKFLGKLYEEVFEATDAIAEQIRALDAYAPGSFTRFLELSNIQCETTIPSGVEMMNRLLEDNEKVLETLGVAFKLAEEFDQQGLADYIAGRIDAHKKHGWMLKSIIK
jgi:starvation-inducible DNA-binding protein